LGGLGIDRMPQTKVNSMYRLSVKKKREKKKKKTKKKKKNPKNKK